VEAKVQAAETDGIADRAGKEHSDEAHRRNPRAPHRLPPTINLQPECGQAQPQGHRRRGGWGRFA
jgi:hypothetical protein